ncbi:P-II family nitrogen regulator [Thermoclostridium caenicola]|uniref:Nitrogen regulatory protein P-II family n=1 Tax=Thermoclostridium caenicola TaxID=659425 RepID=A0A1M6IMC4_9FIRM|nr:P-II family nitrogen regulator [Thermoclostridium caenicola]SHJ35557.1 nitrogen regulatory protein P-II family [Thermoclostridium caenicola]HOP73127.1 P-II family nitrogen regulator [Thermoclostridium caenicola]
MKEVIAIIRLNKVNQTKKALAENGFPAFTCRKVLGRGKKSVDFSLVENIIQEGELPVSPLGEHLTESVRLIPKRVFTLIVTDDQVEKAVETIINANQTGNRGDGKIFVLPILENYQIRTGEAATDAY